MPKTPSSLEMINSLADLCDAAPTALCGLSPTKREELKRYMEILHWKIRNSLTSTTSGVPTTTSLFFELFKLALLVYLSRVTGNQLKQSANVQTHVDRAFEILAQLETCERQLPIFIMGCEACSDAQRAIILDVIARTENAVSSRSMNHVRLLLQALWAQDDLSEGKHYYWEKVSYVISCCTMMPSFV